MNDFVRREFVTAILLAGAYFVFGKVSAYFGVVNSIININIFVPEGIALAIALLFGYRVVWGVFVGQTLYALSNDLGIVVSSAIGISNTIEALLAIYLVRRWKIDIKLGNLYSVLGFFFLVTVVLQPFSALMGNTILLFFGKTRIYDFWFFVASWYFGNLIAQLVITPMLLLLCHICSKQIIELTKLVLTTVLFISLLYFLIVVVQVSNMALLLSTTLVILFVVAHNFGILYGAIGINIIAIEMILLTQNGIGLFTLQSRFDNIVNLNFYLLAHVVIFYIHQAMYREKESLLLQLEKINENLENQVHAEVAKNREQEKYLMYQSRLAQMGEIINMIAHQWRQPLNTLSLLVQTIALKYKKGLLDQEVIEQIQTGMLRQINQMSNTIDSFRNFFKQEKEAVDFDLREVILHVIEISKLEIEKNGITLDYALSSDVRLKGYPNELGQVLLNIINNAKDQLLTCACEEKKISIQVLQVDQVVHIKITDTAGGIPEDVIEKIFDPYFSTKEAKNGTGLGLYISKMIIEDHMQGELFVHNSSQGAVFTIKLYPKKC